MSVHPLAQKTGERIQRQSLVQPGDRVGVAVSGGADSVALLRLLLERRLALGIVVSVVHFNHKLRGEESEQDEHFVAQLAKEHKLAFHASGADVRAAALTRGRSLETTARELRHEFFLQLVTPNNEGRSELDKVATAHTLDDQAETVLMRVLRGTGTRGLAGIYPVVDLENEEEVLGEVLRPLLEVRHQELVEYLNSIHQPWREDSSNRDVKFTRNRVRNMLLPLLEREFNPAVAASLSELAEIARAEEDYWQNEIAGWMGTSIHWTEPEWALAGQTGLVQLQAFNPQLQERLREPGPLVMNVTVDLLWLLSEPVAVQRRAVKAIGELAGVPLEFKHVEEVLRFAAEEDGSGKRLSLPLGWTVLREPAALSFLTPDPRTQERISSDYEYPLALPGRAIVPEAGVVIEALQVNPESRQANDDSDHLWDLAQFAGKLVVRNWRPGDRFWPAHTKSPKKIKELLQEHHITGPARKNWPVVVCGDEIVWLRGFPPPASNRPRNPEQAVIIRDVPMEEQ